MNMSPTSLNVDRISCAALRVEKVIFTQVGETLSLKDCAVVCEGG